MRAQGTGRFHEIQIGLLTSSSPQLSSNIFPDFDMSITESDIDCSNTLAETGESSANANANAKRLLRCQFSDCSEDREFFTESALR
jgi:hypothetical protein